MSPVTPGPGLPRIYCNSRYDIYDNCPKTEQWLKASGKSMRWLKQFLRDNMSNGTKAHKHLLELGGGYDWSCGGMSAMHDFFARTDVQKALHLDSPQPSEFDYRSTGPASITLYPKLVQKIRVLIYNGDSDACVPYKGNEEWTESLETSGVVRWRWRWRCPRAALALRVLGDEGAAGLCI